jgi:DNA uptake protein ComE-like DNA-binding protein
MSVWYDNPQFLQNQIVCSDSRGDTWYFSIYAPNPDDPCSVRSGLIDEAGKININIATSDVLAKLPNLTPELVDSLMVYRGGDPAKYPDGANQDYYNNLPVPYAMKKGPLATLEELLMVKGFTGSIVYGEDYNLNGLLDKNEDDGDASFPPDNQDGVLDTGLMGLATVVSYEQNVDANGKARTNINGAAADLASLGGAGLDPKTVQFIQAYRGEGNVFKHPSQLLGMTYETKTLKDKDGNSLKLTSGVDANNLAKVLDKLTTVAGGAKAPLPGLVNVNTAPTAVLSILPGIDENLAEQIVTARGAVEGDQKSSIAWLISQNVVDAAKFKEIAPVLTARTFQFRVRCMAFAVPSGRFCVLEAVVDAAAGAPHVVYLRDLTHLGMPMPIDPNQLPVPSS